MASLENIRVTKQPSTSLASKKQFFGLKSNGKIFNDYLAENQEEDAVRQYQPEPDLLKFEDGLYLKEYEAQEQLDKAIAKAAVEKKQGLAITD